MSLLGISLSIVSLLFVTPALAQGYDWPRYDRQVHRDESARDQPLNVRNRTSGRARFLVGTAMGYSFSPFRYVLSPQVSAGVSWRLGSADFRLLARGGPAFDARAPGETMGGMGHIMVGGLWRHGALFFSFHWGLGGGRLSDARANGGEHIPFWVDELAIGYSKNGFSIGAFVRDSWSLFPGWDGEDTFYSLTAGLLAEYVVAAHPHDERWPVDRRRARHAIAWPVFATAFTAVLALLSTAFMPA